MSIKTVSRKLHELTEEELAQVTGGDDRSIIYSENTDVLFGDVISTSTGKPTTWSE